MHISTSPSVKSSHEMLYFVTRVSRMATTAATSCSAMDMMMRTCSIITFADLVLWLCKYRNIFDENRKRASGDSPARECSAFRLSQLGPTVFAEERKRPLQARPADETKTGCRAMRGTVRRGSGAGAADSLSARRRRCAGTGGRARYAAMKPVVCAVQGSLPEGAAGS